MVEVPDGGKPFVGPNPKPSERILKVGVGAQLKNECRGLEPLQGREDSLFEGPKPRLGARLRGQWDVDRVVMRSVFFGEAGAREEGPPALVNAAREDARFIYEGVLRAFTVMDVNIHSSHPIKSIEKQVGGKGDIVEDAEAGGPISAGMMETSRDVVGARKVLTV